jgi:hypothetical protein
LVVLPPLFAPSTHGPGNAFLSLEHCQARAYLHLLVGSPQAALAALVCGGHFDDAIALLQQHAANVCMRYYNNNKSFLRLLMEAHRMVCTRACLRN